MSSPKVFISHSWDDKDRFVRKFAEKLRARGVDAWVDEWEMLAGDSLVKKVFCEGIQNAEAFLIILSQNSIQKAWVKEELDLAVVKKIEEGTRIIPILIDDCSVPEPLKSTIWVRVHDLNNYQSEFDKILMAIFGQTDKPPLGSPPNYITNSSITFSDLNEIDSIIFNAICKAALKQHKQFQVPLDQVIASIEEFEIEKDIFNESLSVLSHKYLIENNYGSSVNLTNSGLSKYINEKVPEFYEMEKTIIYELINNGLESKGGKLDFGSINLMYEHYILQRLKDQGLIGYNRTLGNSAIIQGVSPALKRFAAERYN